MYENVLKGTKYVRKCFVTNLSDNGTCLVISSLTSRARALSFSDLGFGTV